MKNQLYKRRLRRKTAKMLVYPSLLCLCLGTSIVLVSEMTEFQIVGLVVFIIGAVLTILSVAKSGMLR